MSENNTGTGAKPERFTIRPKTDLKTKLVIASSQIQLKIKQPVGYTTLAEKIIEKGLKEMTQKEMVKLFQS